MKFALVLLCVLGYYSSVYGSPTAIEQPSAIDNALREFIESIRDIMPCGVEDSGIPPLSPLHIDELPIDIEIPEATIKGLLKNIEILNTHDFDIKQATFSILGLRIRIRLAFRSLPFSAGFQDLIGRYQTDCLVNGHGDASGLLRNFEFFGEFTLAIGLSGLRLSRVNTEISLASLDVDVNGFEGTPEHQHQCNRLIEATLPQTLKNNQRFINQQISDILIPLANEILRELSLNDLIGLISGGGGGFPECNL